MSGKDDKMDIEALEKLIMKCYEQSIMLNEMQSVQVALTDTCKNLQGLLSNTLDRLQAVESELARLSVGVSNIGNKQELLALDSEADHHLYTHRAGVIADWRAELAADLNSDEIPFADSEIKSGIDAQMAIRKKRNERNERNERYERNEQRANNLF